MLWSMWESSHLSHQRGVRRVGFLHQGTLENQVSTNTLLQLVLAVREYCGSSQVIAFAIMACVHPSDPTILRHCCEACALESVDRPHGIMSFMVTFTTWYQLVA
jgi:hypothetical protein